MVLHPGRQNQIQTKVPECVFRGLRAWKDTDYVRNVRKRMLTPYGKITVIKNGFIKTYPFNPSFTYPFHCYSQSVTNDVFNSVWNNARDRIKRKVIIQDYDMGGLGVVDVKKIICRLKLS